MLPVKTSIFYFNDIHGNDDRMSRMKTASDFFSKTRNTPYIDTFKLSGGDILKGSNNDENRMWIEFMNSIGVDASAIGNHELDQGAANFNSNAINANFKFVSSNIQVNPYGALSESVNHGKIVNSWITNKNGHLYGFLGLVPIDEKYKNPGGMLNNNDIKSLDLNATLAQLQTGVAGLRQAGVNKIILLSHFNDEENIIPRTIPGIDVIVSGHMHKIRKGLVPGKNLFASPTGEPVVKLEGGRDGKYAGFLDLVFDHNGKIIAANNNLMETKYIHENMSVIGLKQKYGEYKYPIGTLSETIPLEEGQEMPLGRFIADAVRNKARADVALVLAGSISAGLEKGFITENDIKKVLPYKNKVVTVQLPERAIIRILEKDPTMQVSGFEKKKKDGLYTVAMDDFLLKQLPKQRLKRKYQWSMADATIEKIKNLKFLPFSIKPDGKIQVNNLNPFVNAAQS